MEGPSLVILREELQPFLGKKVLAVTGNTKQPKDDLQGRVLSKIDTWAKVLFLTFSNNKDSIVTKTHFLMFGSYRINDPKDNRSPRLELRFKNGTVYFYSCSILFRADEYLEKIDREVDLMSPFWNRKQVLEKMESKTETYLCDLLLDQTVFAGSGNIVKNEVLFNIRRHPLTRLKNIRKSDWPKIVEATHSYCLNFYKWKKKFQLRQHWQVYRKHYCPICKAKLVKENDGKMNRKSFFCAKHQPLQIKPHRITVHKVLPIQKQPTIERRLDH